MYYTNKYQNEIRICGIYIVAKVKLFTQHVRIKTNNSK